MHKASTSACGYVPTKLHLPKRVAGSQAISLPPYEALRIGSCLFLRHELAILTLTHALVALLVR